MSKQGASLTRSQGQSTPNRGSTGLFERSPTLGRHVCIQRDAAGPAIEAGAPDRVRSVVESPGTPLDSATRETMEPRFGYDFSQVRVHADDRAAESARAVGAHAYTAGSHIVFAGGRPSPGSAAGDRLMAHELTHVVQQSQGPVAGVAAGDGLSVSSPGDAYEAAARRHSAAVTGTGDFHSDESRHRTVPAFTPDRSAIRIQRADTDLSAGTSGAVAGANIAGGVASLGSAVFAAIGLHYASRQADAADKQAAEAQKQTGIAQANLDVAKEALAVAENPPAPAPTTGGIVVNNAGGYPDVPKANAPPGSGAKAGNPQEVNLTLLRVSQGKNDFATFNASLSTNGKDVTGGYLQDGPAQGYLGGSAAANLSLFLKPVEAPPAPKPDKKEKDVRIGAVRFLISGNNIAPRTKTGTQIQRFSGSVTVSAAGVPIASTNFFPADVKKADGSAPDKAVVTVDLAPPAGTPAGAQQPAPAPGPQKAGGGSPAK
ncbi:Metallopeptidase domain-containing protein [Paraburkholderia sacchari]|uniref:eCIS core domain-containing protein n=1 Tax=Paraburkholderia sacchari TaxID=159450 RepID=UPI0039A4B9F1